MRLRHKLINAIGGIDGFTYPETDTELYARMAKTFDSYSAEIDTEARLIALREAVPENPLDTPGIDELTVAVRDRASSARETAGNARERAGNAAGTARDAAERAWSGIRYIGNGVIKGARGAYKVAGKINRARKKVQAFVSTCWDLGMTAAQITGTLLTIIIYLYRAYQQVSDGEPVDHSGDGGDNNSSGGYNPADHYDEQDWVTWVMAHTQRDQTIEEAVEEADDYAEYDIEHLIEENEDVEFAGDSDDDDIIDV